MSKKVGKNEDCALEVDFKTLCQIFKMREQPLRKAVSNVVNKMYDKKDISATKDFVCAWGEIPVALVAHLDTVHAYPPIEIFYDKDRQVIWSPEGIGADDRAGVYAILSLLVEGYRPTVVFTTREEVGGLGAEELIAVHSKPKVPVHFLIELDRRGEDDMVFYDCDNPDFESFIEKYGFRTNYGSFSDISVIAPEWKVAAVNLSIGYMDEHTKAERLYCNNMIATINKVRRILEDASVSCPKFKYIPTPTCAYSYGYGYGYDEHGQDYGHSYNWDSTVGDISKYYGKTMSTEGLYRCDSCDSIVPKDRTKTIYDHGTYWRLCPDCVKRMTKKCKKCGNRFMAWEKEEVYCGSCLSKMKKGKA